MTLGEKTMNDLLPQGLSVLLAESGVSDEFGPHLFDTLAGGTDNLPGLLPLSPMQEGMLFHHQLDPKNDGYVHSIILEVEGETVVQAVVECVQRVIDRHEALRTAVMWRSVPRPLQVIFKTAKLSATELSLSDESNQVELLKSGKVPHVDWDLEKAPLTRVRSVRSRGQSKRYVVLEVHHLVCDYRSMRRFVCEVTTLLKESGTELADAGNIAREPEGTVGEYRESAVSYFRDRLSSVSEPTVCFGVTERQDLRSAASARCVVPSPESCDIRAAAE